MESSQLWADLALVERRPLLPDLLEIWGLRLNAWGLRLKIRFVYWGLSPKQARNLVWGLLPDRFCGLRLKIYGRGFDVYGLWVGYWV